MTLTEQQKLAVKRMTDFVQRNSSILMLSSRIATDYIKELNMSKIAVDVTWRRYKKKVEEFEQKERKRKHNKKKSDRMKRLRVKKEKKRA